MIVSFYTDNIDPRVAEAQKSVFDYFGIPINQIKPELWHGHAGAIDRFLNDYKWEDNKPIIIMDIDCIPLDKYIISVATRAVEMDNAIYSVAQKASHIPVSPIYASPAFIVFSKETYEKLGKPSFVGIEGRSDCAGELTYAAREKGIEIRLLYPSHVEVPLWDLDGPFRFGKGTTYGGRIYHAFYSRKDNGEMFINKCKEVTKS